MMPNARTIVPKGSCMASHCMDVCARDRAEEAEHDDQEHRPDDHEAQVLADAAHDGARPLDVPGEIERLLELLDRGQ